MDMSDDPNASPPLHNQEEIYAAQLPDPTPTTTHGIVNPDDPEVWAERVRQSSEGPTEEELSREWVSDEALAALVDDKSSSPATSDQELARKVLQEGAPAAAKAVVHLALHSASENTRFRAAQYVLDRTLGKPGDDLRDKGEDPLNKFLQEIYNATPNN